MLIKKEPPYIEQDCFSYKDKDDSDDEGELKIDLDYDEYHSTPIKGDNVPLDCTVNKVSDHLDRNDIPNIPKIEIKPNLIFSKIVEQKGVEGILKGSKNSILSELDLEKLLDPFMKNAEKKFICTICNIKFSNKVKAKAHIENKHVDCLQYKCPLCKSIKPTRLAYESHIRRGHGENVKSYSPLIRCKKNFFVKSKADNESLSKTTSQPYDLTFVTFLRHILALAEEAGGTSSSWHKTVNCAEWVEKDQGIFRINNRQELITRWCSFKVIIHVQFIFGSCYSIFRDWSSYPGTLFIRLSSQSSSKERFSNPYLMRILSSKYFVLNSC